MTSQETGEATCRQKQRPELPQPRKARGPQKLEEAGRIFPWSLGKERGPADTLISDFWPLELGEAEQVSVAVSPPVCDNLLWWPLEIDGTGGSHFLSDLSLRV